MQPAPLDVSLYRYKRYHANNRPTSNTTYVVKDTDLKQKEIATEAEKETEKKAIVDTQTLTTVSQKANRVFFHISSVFPFDFFPDELMITDTEVHIIFHTFFAAEQLHTIDISDITNVFIETAPIFATLIIVSRTFTQNNIAIHFLKKKEAAHARDLIDGLRLLRAQRVDVTKIPTNLLTEKLDQFSTTSVSNKVV